MNKPRSTVQSTRSLRATNAVSATAQPPSSFELLQPELAAIPPSELLLVNLDVGAAAMVVLGAVPRIAPFSETMLALPHTPARSVRGLLAYAQAAFDANSLWLHAAEEPDEVQRLMVEGAPLRARLLAVAEMLVVFGVFTQAFVDGIRARTGYRNTAEDLVVLHSEFETRWAQCEGKVPLARAELDRARSLATELVAALGARESGTLTSVTRATDARQRAFTALSRAYDDVRCALGYLRWAEGDADEIAPSLYARPHGSRRGGNELTPVTPPVTPPVVPADPTVPSDPNA